jgi:SAM-dependent methyltransferase
VKLYSELAEWYPVFATPEECRKEAVSIARALRQASRRKLHDVLELGSGVGNIAFHVKRHFAVTLVDQSPNMLAASQALNPDCEHIEADIRSFRLGRSFDAVFVQDAICHMTTEQDLRAVMETAFVHLRPGGVALFVPDHVRETFVEDTDQGGNDTDRGSVRFLQWVTDPDPRDTSYLVDFAIMIRDEQGDLKVAHDRHVYGLFPRATWRSLLRAVGFKLKPGSVALNGIGRDSFIGRRPA